MASATTLARPDEDFALEWEEIQQAAHGRRLAGSVGPPEGHRFTRPGGKGQVIDGREPPKTFGQVTHLNNFCVSDHGLHLHGSFPQRVMAL